MQNDKVKEDALATLSDQLMKLQKHMEEMEKRRLGSSSRQEKRDNCPSVYVLLTFQLNFNRQSDV